ncbi:MAG: CBS domain-containing protein [Desulfobacterales bacterium]|nr:CBS domain-containing protein [Desulfobacterales bacterium]
MKIKSLMIVDPITITESADITEAIELMKSKSIRHLPVVSPDDTLLGFITLADLRLGLMPSLVGDVSLSDLIIKNPITIHPDDDIETAAKLIYKYKISGIPVVRGMTLVGIITETDILRAFIDMMGILTASARIEVVIGEKPGALKQAFQIITDSGGDIINVGMNPIWTDKRVYFFRLSPNGVSAIKKALESAGFEVLETIE